MTSEQHAKIGFILKQEVEGKEGKKWKNINRRKRQNKYVTEEWGCDTVPNIKI
jgi:hypothetical protein